MAQITKQIHEILGVRLLSGGVYIDATAGKGSDTLFLSEIAGPQGRVLAFDLQRQALDLTYRRLEEKGMAERCRLILDSHEHMDRYVEPDSVAGIMFNFGYLPGGDHQMATRPAASRRAVEKALALLAAGGILSLCIYQGGDTGYDERDEILSLLRELDNRTYTVCRLDWLNHPADPPIPVFVVKEAGKNADKKGTKEKSW